MGRLAGKCAWPPLGESDIVQGVVQTQDLKVTATNGNHEIEQDSVSCTKTGQKDDV